MEENASNEGANRASDLVAIKSGNYYFWYDNWIGLGALYHASSPDHWCDESIVHVDEVVENGAWNEDQLRDLLPDKLVDHIIETIKPPSVHNQKDKPWWKLETKGKFSVKSAWQHPKEETLPNIFLKSPVAKFIWKYISAPAWINIEGKKLVQVVNEWWRRPVNANLKPVYHAMPSLIKYTRVLWHLPPVEQIKYNTDGACIGDNEGASYSFCIRDGIGDLLYVQADSIEDATNNIAVSHEILVRYMIQSQYRPCVIETDSFLMKKVLEEVWEHPWSIAQQVEDIKALMTRGVFQVEHVLREGNKLDVPLANLTLEHQAMLQVHSFEEMDTQGRKILSSDKLQIPYIRVRTTKPNTK
ncbi:uncharacterized protein LOC142172565 [Nicotiana tabacum]|uniref:Uncharacterized protein LOC142172565 n=1 Tax=Nicotiana tabacum TaxID=4097 RepID=A0AC58T506_TOBAC